MARMFISYSRANKAFVEALVPLLARVFSDHEIWFDEHISGGEDWWQSILQEIERCDIFIYLLSNDSVTSEYCQAEFREALRLQKSCLPVIVQPRTDVSKAPIILEQEIRRREWVDMSGGLRDYQANARLYAAINRLLKHLPQESPPALTNEPMSKPDISLVQSRGLRQARAARMKRNVAVIGLIGLVGAAISIAAFGQRGSVSNIGTTESLSTDSTSQTVGDTPTTMAAQIMPPTLEIALLVGTLDAEATFAQATADANTTAQSRATSYAAGTQEQLDKTPTLRPDAPNVTDTRAATASFTSTLPPEVKAFTPVITNEAWTAFVHDFEGVEMVLVPAGCFEIGNDPQAYYWNGSQWNVGVPSGGRQCFDKPFWIDQYEVTNEQFEQLRGVAEAAGDWSGPQLPRTNVSWFEARDFCENRRQARLPTEVEWEYAARGPDNLVYPWGNEFVADNVTYSQNSRGRTVDVGSKAGGASWIGAYDLGGNVWEWVRTMNKDYPYNTLDGREDQTDESVGRILRGGSWLNDGDGMRAANRLWTDPNVQGPHGGFRCARSPSDTTLISITGQ